MKRKKKKKPGQARAGGLAVASPPSVEVAGQQLTLYVDAMAYITAVLRDIRAARSRVWLETYIFLDDVAGQAVAHALMEKAREGLDVRVHYDAIGSLSAPGRLWSDMEEAGVKVHAFHSLGEAFYRFSLLRILNRRNHRKLIVVDDHVAYFGGMNIADVSGSVGLPHGGHPRLSTGWRDVHVRLEGTRAAELAESFERSWLQARGEKVSRRPRAYRRGEVLDAGPESIQLVDSGPGGPNTRAGRLFTQLIRRAEKRLTFSMAYFLPVGRVRRELIRAARRGVKITVIVPGNSDVPVVQYASRHLYTSLLKRGIRIYEQQVNMLHSKVVIMDNEWAVVGSANIDARSLWINLEMLAVVRSRAFVRALNEIVRAELRRSHEITLENYPEKSWWRKLRNALFWTLRWWL